MPIWYNRGMNTPAISVLFALAVMFGESGILAEPFAYRQSQQQSVESLLAAATVANRAYDYEQRYDESAIPEAVDPRLVDAPYDPSWELEPRWSTADIARRDETVARGQGPGLARTQSTETEKKKDAI